MKTRKLTYITVFCTAAVIAPLASAEPLAGSVAPPPPGEVKVPTVEKGSLSAVIGDSVTFSTLKKALIAADLDITLGTKGTYTIFAPTDEAFDKLPTGLLGRLMLPENKEKLRSLLLYHVIPGQMLASQLKDGEVKTMNGEKVEIDVESDKVEINDSKVFSTDVMATNGVMHSIGTVLIPPTLKDFSPLDK